MAELVLHWNWGEDAHNPSISIVCTQHLEETQRKEPAGQAGKIPQPPNAFIMFTKDWRSKLAKRYMNENNYQISIRLGELWKDMKLEQKAIYMEQALQVKEEHTRKYPNYRYSSKARIQKEWQRRR
jgi:transcription factor SOX1/3/14/21 (SOX group B)